HRIGGRRRGYPRGRTAGHHRRVDRLARGHPHGPGALEAGAVCTRSTPRGVGPPKGRGRGPPPGPPPPPPSGPPPPGRVPPPRRTAHTLVRHLVPGRRLLGHRTIRRRRTATTPAMLTILASDQGRAGQPQRGETNNGLLAHGITPPPPRVDCAGSRCASRDVR